MSRIVKKDQVPTVLGSEDALLTVQQEGVILHVLSGATQCEAAQQVGVAPETVSRWMHNDAQFVAELNRRRRALWDAHADTLQSLAGQAIGTLEGLLNANDDRIRLAAAVAILKATALHEAGRPSGPTDEAAIRMDWMLSENIGMR